MAWLERPFRPPFLNKRSVLLLAGAEVATSGNRDVGKRVLRLKGQAGAALEVSTAGEAFVAGMEINGAGVFLF